MSQTPSDNDPSFTPSAEVDRLVGATVPPVTLASTLGPAVNLAELAEGLLVAYAYPRTKMPGVDIAEAWDEVPGIRACTPRNCAYRDQVQAFGRLGASLVGISTQDPAEQLDFAVRERIEFPLLNDRRLILKSVLDLPTFEVDGREFYSPLTFIARAGQIVKVFYPIFPPGEDAYQVLAWLKDHLEELQFIPPRRRPDSASGESPMTGSLIR